jgi:hypothetical protein
MSSRTKRRSSPEVESHPGVVTSTTCVAPASGGVAGGADPGAIWQAAMSTVAVKSNAQRTLFIITLIK